MPFAPRRRRSPGDLPPEKQWTDRVRPLRISRPVPGDEDLNRYGDPRAAPPPSEP